MDKTYLEAVTKMEKMKLNPEYVLGWQGGYLHHPQREEQRQTEAYTAGYEDGQEKNTDNFENWLSK